jgi:hypothetical protein
MGARTGAVDETLNRPLAEKQAASIGATIGSDGWWYKDGRRLSHDEADALTRQAGTAAENLGAWGKNRDIWGRASDFVSKGWAMTPLGQIKIGGDVGGFLERNKADIAAGVGTILSGGNPLVGAAIKAGLEGAKYGATGLDAAKGALSGYGAGTIASGLQGATKAALSSTGGVMDTAKAAYGGFGAGTTAAKQSASDTLAGWFGKASTMPVAGNVQDFPTTAPGVAAPLQPPAPRIPDALRFSASGVEDQVPSLSMSPGVPGAPFMGTPAPRTPFIPQLASAEQMLPSAAPGAPLIGTPAARIPTIPNIKMSYLGALKNIFSPEELSKMSLKDVGGVLSGLGKGYEGYQEGQRRQQEVDVLRRKQELLEKDYARQLEIAAARERELAPMRAQLMQMLMGQPSTLFGGSVLQGLTEPKRNV